MNFQAYLENAYRIIKEEPLILIIGGLIAQVLTVLSLGILAGPLLGGYMLLIILYLRENKKPSFSDVFSGLQQFTRLLPYFLVLLIIFIGLTLLVLPGLLFATWWIYVLPLMVDRKMSFTDAMRLSMSRVNKKGFLMHLVFLLLISFIPIMLINLATAVIPLMFVLKILLPPFQVGCLASLYLDIFPESAAELDAELHEVKASQPPITDPPGEETASGTGPEENSSINDQPPADGATVHDDAGTRQEQTEDTEPGKPDTD